MFYPASSSAATTLELKQTWHRVLHRNVEDDEWCLSTTKVWPIKKRVHLKLSDGNKHVLWLTKACKLISMQFLPDYISSHWCATCCYVAEQDYCFQEDCNTLQHSMIDSFIRKLPVIVITLRMCQNGGKYTFNHPCYTISLELVLQAMSHKASKIIYNVLLLLIYWHWKHTSSNLTPFQCG